MTTTPTLRSITVKYQLDPTYPVLSANIKYRVFLNETEITFPTGDKRTFNNWDVRGLREKYYCEEIADQHSVEDGATVRSKNVELIEHGIRPCDVQAFVAKLADNSRYENFFDMDFDNAPEPPPAIEVPKEIRVPVPKVETKQMPRAKKAKKDARKFPYLEVARMWAEGLTQREIAKAIGRLDDNPKDPCHTLRTFLTKMHQKGYRNAEGQLVKLPYRAKRAAA